MTIPWAEVLFPVVPGEISRFQTVSNKKIHICQQIIFYYFKHFTAGRSIFFWLLHFLHFNVYFLKKQFQAPVFNTTLSTKVKITCPGFHLFLKQSTDISPPPSCKHSRGGKRFCIIAFPKADLSKQICFSEKDTISRSTRNIFVRKKKHERRWRLLGSSQNEILKPPPMSVIN